MERRLLLLSVLVFSSLFLSMEGDNGTIGFLFSEMKLAKATWFYFLFEKLIVVVLAYVIWTYERSVAMTVFLSISVIDTIDYILLYGEPWFDSKIFTWNTIKVGMMGTSIIYEKWNKS